MTRITVYYHEASYRLSPDSGGDPTPRTLLVPPQVTIRTAPVSGKLVADREGGPAGIPLSEAIELGWCRFEESS